jgi:hypothetical protein
MKMIFIPEQKIFMVESYFPMVTHFEKVTVFSRSTRPKVRTEKTLRLSKVKWKTNPNYLLGNYRSRLSYQS